MRHQDDFLLDLCTPNGDGSLGTYLLLNPDGGRYFFFLCFFFILTSERDARHSMIGQIDRFSKAVSARDLGRVSRWLDG